VITTTSLERLRNEFKGIPLVGTAPVVKKAARWTKNGKIGILSTNGTAKSLYQKHLIEQFTTGLEVVNLGTNALVPLVEQGILEGRVVEKTLEQVVRPFTKMGVDVVALGCTHFPFLKKEIQRALEKKTTLLDSGSAVARQVERILEKNKITAKKAQATHIVFTTGNTDMWANIMKLAKLPQATLAQIILR
jgi:glutamate racemase